MTLEEIEPRWSDPLPGYKQPRIDLRFSYGDYTVALETNEKLEGEELNQVLVTWTAMCKELIVR